MTRHDDRALTVTTAETTQAGEQPGLAAHVGRGIVAGLAATVVMTIFQKAVEMPLTGRGDSYAPAALAEKLLPVRASTPEARRRLNYVSHFALGGLWGAVHGAAAGAGLRGQTAVNTTFATMYSGDVLLNTALGLYRPSTWSAQDWAVDLADKYVQAQATGAFFDRFLDPAR